MNDLFSLSSTIETPFKAIKVAENNLHVQCQTKLLIFNTIDLVIEYTKNKYLMNFFKLGVRYDKLILYMQKIIKL